MRVEVNPALLRWARERSGLTTAALSKRFTQIDRWERAEAKPTLKQLEALASATHTPIGFFFLSQPPVETLSIPDFRTLGNRRLTRPSPNLLDMLSLCQQRQIWYREFAKVTGEEPLSFVGSAGTSDSPEKAAAQMREILGFGVETRRSAATWEEALRTFISLADDQGILVMCSGVVLNNTHRKLDPEEFRGFALTDDLAPLVFINGSDSKAAQMFTLAHELAHIWCGQSALDDATPSVLPSGHAETWCNQVAAEFLVPLSTLENELRSQKDLDGNISRLARIFKVSTLVILRRLHDAKALSKTAFHAAYEAELARIAARPRGTGGNFYLTQAARVSKRFARALVASTLEGHTLYRDAYRLLGISKAETFDGLGRSLGFPL